MKFLMLRFDSSCNCSQFTFQDSNIQAIINGDIDNFTFHFTVQNGGLFYLYFANCEVDTPVSFHSKISMYNIDSTGKKDYLSVGESHLSIVFWVRQGVFEGRACMGWLLS